MARPQKLSRELLQAALAGLERQLADVNRSIADVSGRLKLRRAAPVAVKTASARPRRTMSPAARKRIAEAQRKRWAAFHAGASVKAVQKAAKRGPAGGKKAAARKKAPAARTPAVSASE